MITLLIPQSVDSTPIPYIAFVPARAPRLPESVRKDVGSATATPKALADGSVVAVREGMHYYFSGELNSLKRLRLQVKMLGPALAATEQPYARLWDLGPEAFEFVKGMVATALPLYNADTVTPDTYLEMTSCADVELKKDGKTILALPNQKPFPLTAEQWQEHSKRFHENGMRYKSMPKGMEAFMQDTMAADAKSVPFGTSIRFDQVITRTSLDTARYMRVGTQLYEEIVGDRMGEIMNRWGPQIAAWKARYPEINPRLGEPMTNGRSSKGEPTENAIVTRVTCRIMIKIWGEDQMGVAFDLYP